MDKKLSKKKKEIEKEEKGEMLTLKKVSCSTHRLVPDKRPRYIKCADCGIGYILTPGSEYKNGHIYIDNKLVI